MPEIRLSTETSEIGSVVMCPTRVSAGQLTSEESSARVQ
jgi:hypothetical protein